MTLTLYVLSDIVPHLNRVQFTVLYVEKPAKAHKQTDSLAPFRKIRVRIPAWTWAPFSDDSMEGLLGQIFYCEHIYSCGRTYPSDRSCWVTTCHGSVRKGGMWGWECHCDCARVCITDKSGLQKPCSHPLKWKYKDDLSCTRRQLFPLSDSLTVHYFLQCTFF